MNCTTTLTRIVLALAVASMAHSAQAVQSIDLTNANADFESPTWVNSSGSWSYQSLAPGAMAPNYNSQDPRFGTPGWGKTAVYMGGGGTAYTNGITVNGSSQNSEGMYGAQNNTTTPAGKYYNYTDGSLPAPASGQQFFSVLAPQFSSGYAPTYNATYASAWNPDWNGPGTYQYHYTQGTNQLPWQYNFWIDEQQNVTSNILHTNVNYPPLIAPATTIAGHSYTATVALGNPLWNQANGNSAFPVVELDMTTGANFTTGNYNGEGTVVKYATANGSSDSNWQSPNFTPGMFKDLSVTWTATQSGLPLDLYICVTGFTQAPGTAYPNMVSLDNVRLVDNTATPEPASATLLAIGLATLLVYAWRRRGP